jgi:hypothetical protein
VTSSRAPKDPPPCNQQCWTWVGQGHHHGWIYTDAADACGHQADPITGRWTWNRRPAPQNRQETPR